jgi:hypothetical protein
VHVCLVCATGRVGWLGSVQFCSRGPRKPSLAGPEIGHPTSMQEYRLVYVRPRLGGVKPGVRRPRLQPEWNRTSAALSCTVLRRHPYDVERAPHAATAPAMRRRRRRPDSGGRRPSGLGFRQQQRNTVDGVWPRSATVPGRDRSAYGWLDEDGSPAVSATAGPHLRSGTLRRATTCNAAGTKTDPRRTPLRGSLLR